MSLPSDPAEALKWATNHTGDAWWMIVAIGAGIAWINKRLRDWNRRNTIAVGRAKLAPPAKPTAAPVAPAPVAAASAYAAAPSYAAAGYTAQPAYAAPKAAAAQPAASSSRKLYREGAPVQRAVAPVARSVDVAQATASGTWTLAAAFGDPANARTAIVVAEVLGPPLGLR